MSSLPSFTQPRHWFVEKFRFNEALLGYVGVEREVFLCSLTSGQITPQASRVCRLLELSGQFPGDFGPELSACQVEFRTKPVPLSDLQSQLTERGNHLRVVCGTIGLQPMYLEVAGPDMTTEVYPDERYRAIARRLHPEVLSAACRVTGTHVHIGMPDFNTALRVYNRVISHTEELIELGDDSSGERLRLYRMVAPSCDPTPVASVESLYERALTEGFAENVRNWWSLIRITRYGTIEFRMFGNTSSVAQVCAWAKRCHELCMDVL
jgi:gamma-glutamyl:cysteine ligase YbdK (ATP-grasp superfamily)